MKRALLWVFSFLGTSCLAPRMVLLSEEAFPTEQAKGLERVWQQSPSVLEASAPERTAELVEKPTYRAPGSLVPLDNQQAYLFAQRSFDQGQFLQVRVPINVEDREDKKKNINAPAPYETLMMRISSREPNGDLICIFERASSAGKGQGNISVRARVPYNFALGQESLSVRDLTDLILVETNDEQRIESRASQWPKGWEKRIFGFEDRLGLEEAALVERRKALEETTQRLNTRMEAMNKERSTMAKENEALRDKVQKLQEKKGDEGGSS